jgi:hypothetical protein
MVDYPYFLPFCGGCGLWQERWWLFWTYPTWLLHLRCFGYQWSTFKDSLVLVSLYPSLLLLQWDSSWFRFEFYWRKSKSVKTISWSDNPGITSTRWTWFGKFVIMRSKVLPFRVGMSTICARPVSPSKFPKR